MKIFEEYFQRHDIIDVPLVRHCTNGSLILESFDSQIWKSKWVIFSIRWVDHDHRPGHYLMEINVPQHDGHETGEVFDQQVQIEKKWQEYEDFILDWSKNIKGVRPIKGKEAIIFAWEMFVYVYDSWFLKQPESLKQKLFQSLDKDNSIQTRYSSYQDVAIFLSTHHPAVMRVWKYEILAKLQYDTDWLARLIERNYESAQKRLVQSEIVA